MPSGNVLWSFSAVVCVIVMNLDCIFVISGYRSALVGHRIIGFCCVLQAFLALCRVGADFSWIGSGFSRVGDMFHGDD